MDAEVLGCGGNIIRHIKAGHHVAASIVAYEVDDYKYSRELEVGSKTIEHV